jgi:2-dehydropantoate 2-reductase
MKERGDRRIAIVGAGAVGAYVGGYFARAGEDIILIDPWPENVEAMRSKGITLTGVTAPECFQTGPVRALHLTELQGLSREKPIDIAFVCVKSYDTAWATMMIKDYLAPGGFVVSLQNCMNEETIAGIVGWGRTTGCIAAKIAVGLTGPGEVKRGVPLGGNKHTVFRAGEPHGRATTRIQAIVGMLAEIDSSMISDNLWGERWSKLCANAMTNGVTGASGLSSNQSAREPITRRLSIRIGGEAVKVGRAMGFELETINKFKPDQWIAAADGDAQVIAAIEESMLAGTIGQDEERRPSMAQDIQKGRRTEIDYINGLIAEKGKEIGMPTPANSGLTEAVHRVERGEVEPALDVVSHI